ncbi:MAG: hypothetical protein ACK6BZ_03100, partial [Candidatus Kapaibacterium sp.]
SPVEQLPALTVPQTYDTAGFAAASKQPLLWRASLVNLTNEIKKGRTKGTKLDLAQLNLLFNENGFAATSTSYYRTILETYMQEIVYASGSEYDPFKTPEQNGQGGVLGAYLFDEKGIEPEQLIEKGLFGAALYHYAVTQYLTGTITKEKLHQALVLFGADPSFPNTNTATNTQKPDIHGALYAARRDNNDGNGFYRSIEKNFRIAQAALKAGSKYSADLQNAIKAIREQWEKALLATVVNYSYATVDGLKKTNPTPAEIGAALHAYSEGVGFIHGFKTIPNKIITDAQIDEILTLMLAKDPQNVTSYLFVTEPATYLKNFDDIRSKIKAIYGFSDADMESFKKNWISEQKR